MRSLAVVVTLFIVIGGCGQRGGDQDDWITDEYLASINHPALSDYQERERVAETLKSRAKAAEVTVFGHVVEDAAKLTDTERERLSSATPEQRDELTRAMQALTQSLNEQADSHIRLEAAREANKRAAQTWYVNLDEAEAMRLHKKRSEGRNP